MRLLVVAISVLLLCGGLCSSAFLTTTNNGVRVSHKQSTILNPSLSIHSHGGAALHNDRVLSQNNRFAVRKTTTRTFLSKSSTPTSSSRNMTSLQTWATENGVRFALTNFEAQGQEEDEEDWGVTLQEDTEAQQVIMRVPKTLVWNSQVLVQRELSKAFLQPGLDLLAQKGYGNQLAEFVLFIKLLVEHEKYQESLWYPWIQSLPTKFDTGVCMSPEERDCLPPFASALCNYEWGRLECFRYALEAVIREDHDDGTLLIPLLQNVIGNDHLTQWAFNVIFTRCWKYAPDENNGDANDDQIDFDRSDIVPFGDMFNHQEPGNVVVQDLSSQEYVDFVLTENTPASSPLHLSYGMTNPYRFLIIFGFVYPEMPEIFCQVLYSDPSPELLNLGCNDRSKMVYRTQDGAIANTVWDSVLYSLLAQVPDTQSQFYQACMEDPNLKDEIHRKYRLEVCLTLRNHVIRTLNELDEFSEKTNMYLQQQQQQQQQQKEDSETHHSRLPMIRNHIDFLQSTFQKVKERLDGMAKDEKDLRMKNMSSQS